jgi:sarcosine oxidase subunit beta
VASTSFDIAIIGGGISGTAAAYELAKTGARVVLLERGDLASMASGWTLAGVRQSGRHPAELPLAQHAVRRWERLAEELDADVEYRQDGNLRLARTEDEVPTIQALVDDQRGAGLDVSFVPDNAAIREITPALAESIVAASWCPSDGHANPTATVQAFAAAAERHGATIRTGITVEEIVVGGGKIQGVRADGESISATVVILAAGVHSDRLLQQFGIDLPLTIRHVSVIQSVALPPMLGPVLGTAKAEFAGRQQADGRLRFTGGIRPWTGKEAGTFAESVQPPADAVASTISRGMEIIPMLASTPIAQVWGGLIDMSPDALPVLDRSQEIDGLVVAAGFSGHGFCLGPTTGQILCELATRGESSLPLDPFRLGRFTSTTAAKTELHG